MVYALVVGDTDLPARARYQAYATKADLVVAADGGANRALEAGLAVDWVVGDMDGILPATLERIPAKRIRKDLDPDHTDLEKVLAFLVRRKVREATLIGFVGGRLDHTLGVVAVLCEWSRRLRLRLVDDHFTTFVVHKDVDFRAPIGTMVSIIAPSGATGVTSKGLKFPLQRRALPFSSLGIHNEVSSNPVRIQVEQGPLVVLQSHEIWPHR